MVNRDKTKIQLVRGFAPLKCQFRPDRLVLLETLNVMARKAAVMTDEAQTAEVQLLIETHRKELGLSLLQRPGLGQESQHNLIYNFFIKGRDRDILINGIFKTR